MASDVAAEHEDGNLIVEREGQVVTVLLNRPERLNALDRSLRTSLANLWRSLSLDRDVRCIIVSGAGRGFCSGADTADLTGERSPMGEGLGAELAFLPGTVVSVPVLCAVNGICAGGGLHFVADADFTIAGRAASFVDPHVDVGQVSGIEPVSLVLRMHVQAVARMALLGTSERVDAETALRLGLVTEVVDDERLLSRAMELALVISQKSPEALRATRAGLRKLESDLLHAAMVRGWSAVQAQWSHPDATEGPLAFIERRPPNWSDRRAAES